MRFDARELDEAARILARALEQGGMFPGISAREGNAGEGTEAGFAAKPEYRQEASDDRSSSGESAAGGEETEPPVSIAAPGQARQMKEQGAFRMPEWTRETSEVRVTADIESFSDRLMRDSRRYDGGFERY